MSALNEGFQLFMQGRLTDAEAMIRSHLMLLPEDLDAQLMLGVVLASRGLPAQAEPWFAQVLQQRPNDQDARLNLGLALREQDKLSQARQILQPFAAQPDNVGNALLTYAEVCAALGDNNAAEAAWRRAISDPVTEANARLTLGRVLAKREETDEAELQYRGAAALDDLDAEQLSNLGQLALALERDDAALEHFRKAVVVDAGAQTARAFLARTLEKLNRVEEAEQVLQAGGAALAAESVAQLVAARLLSRRGDSDKALQLLQSAVQRENTGEVAAELSFELAKVLDKLNQPEGAYQAAVRANRLARGLDPAQTTIEVADRRPEFLVDLAEADRARMGAADRASLEAESPIFVVGFPRSGTTLVDRLLDAHPQLEVLEEKPTLGPLVNQIEKRGGNYTEHLADLSAEELDALRQQYWREVAKYHQRTPGTRLVDKYPLNMVRLPLLARLFPNAPIVFVLRDPRDAVLSCFMQHFRADPRLIGFSTLANSVRLYEWIMGHFLDHWQRLSSPVYTLRYESLVADPDTQVRALIEGLKLPWSDEVQDYRDKLHGQRIGTPSYAQVTQPINARAIERWRRYETFFGDDGMRRLAPFVERFGY